MRYHPALFIPGPTNIPDAVRRAMDLPMEDMRAPDFPQFTLPPRPPFADVVNRFGIGNALLRDCKPLRITFGIQVLGPRLRLTDKRCQSIDRERAIEARFIRRRALQRLACGLERPREVFDLSRRYPLCFRQIRRAEIAPWRGRVQLRRADKGWR